MRLGVSLALVATAGCAVEREAAPERPQVADLQALCRPEAVQAIASMVSSTKVTVQQIPIDPKLAGGVKFFAATDKLPAFCQVTGSFVTNPKTGKTANFLATFPANWNGKYLQLGCSGHCGNFAVSNPATPVITITNQGYPGQIIEKGYAAFATDEGHVGMEAVSWAVKGPGQVDEDTITDYLYRADLVLSRMGKAFTTAFYDRANGASRKISYSYFSGCSGGGRDAFVAASYFPEAFDGIVGGSAYNLMGRAFHGTGTALATIRTEDAAVPDSMLALIDPIVKAQCDKVDGVEDGLIQNPAACNFRPERDLPRCEGGKPGGQCFTPTQIETVSTVLTAATDEQGNVVQPGYSVSEVLPGFAPTIPPKDRAAEDPWSHATGLDAQMWSLANGSLKVFVHKNDPKFSSRSIVSFRSGGPGNVTGYRAVVPRTEVARAMAAGRMGIGHFPENAARLIKLNRKFLIWHNFSDEKLTPYMSINYYKQLAKMHGGYARLQNNVRLFMIPGSSHCSMSGVGPNNFDALTAIENWVEKGQAPDALPAALYDPKSPMIDRSKKPVWTMPLCNFPEMARYSGQGDVRDAKNWSCPSGDTSMLKVGESGRRAGVIE